MADAAAPAPAPAGGESRGRGGFGRGRGGDRDRRGPPRSGASARAGAGEEGEWVPLTKLGRLVQAGRIKSIEEIAAAGYKIREYQIVDALLPTLEDDVQALYPIQKQTSAGQRTRFKCYVAVGDKNGHIGLGCKTASEVATAIRGAIWAAKMNITPVRRGFWGLMSGAPHTVATKLTGAAGSVRVRLIPAPRGTGLVAAPQVKKLLTMAGIEDCYTSTRGNSKTQSNFVKAVVDALSKSYGYLTPDLWPERRLDALPYEQNSELLAKAEKGKAGRRY